VDFFEALPEVFQTLHLTEFEDSTFIKDLLVCIPQLEILIIDWCYSELFADLVGPFEPASSHMGASTLPPDLLPNLPTLRMKCYGRYMKHFVSFARVLKNWMKKRSVDKDFRVEILPDDYAEWSPRAKNILRSLIVYDGAPLRIFNGDEEMFLD
jgi:hypothetical protein